MTGLMALLAAGALAGQAGGLDWEYSYSVPGSSVRKTLTVVPRQGNPYVSMKQFCFALGCSSFHRWAEHKAVIENKVERVSAIVSSMTRIALVDGQVVAFGDPVLSEPREGYMLPADLAIRLAELLKLGVIERREPAHAKKPTKSINTAVKVSPAPRAPFKKLVIDPGHGGNDLGTGLGGIHEKDVAVIYASRLREELRVAMPDLEVILTREDDRYVSLPDRAKIANEAGANFFLSLHVNHAPNPRIEGAETYILNPEATDDDARKLALLENEEWLKRSGIAPPAGAEAKDVVRKILVDVEQTKYIQDSALAASFIQSELAAIEPTHGLKSRGVKQAMFYVLSQVAMPSALVEIGFLSNTGDRGRLMNLAFRDEFVKSVVNALKNYRAQLAK